MYKREEEDLKIECHRAALVAKVKCYVSEQLFKSLHNDLGLDTKINKHDAYISPTQIFLFLIRNCLSDGASLALK